ncbi:MAG: hypothetical protein LUD69_08035 [Oscillospiraceae bacterium]|nr:hypothetical protein [Oscillospiraceae bacterium]
MRTVFQKLTSRKFLAAIVGVVTGLAVIFGLDEGIVTSVAGAVVSVTSVIAYIVTEGYIDATAVAVAAEAVETAIEELTGDDEENTEAEE